MFRAIDYNEREWAEHLGCTCIISRYPAPGKLYGKVLEECRVCDPEPSSYPTSYHEATHEC